MKHIHKFESFVGDNISSHKKEEISEHTARCLSNLGESDLEQVKREIEKFALDNNCSVDELADPEFVKSLLKSNVSESVGSWIKDNWYKLCNYIGIGGKIAGLITFVGSLVMYYSTGTDTMTGIKIGVAAYIISNIVQSLKGLEELKES